MEITVGTGDAKAIWGIPKALLSHHSEFFRKACNGSFKEGVKNKLSLPEYDPKHFQIFLQWMYFDNLPKLPAGSFAGGYIVRFQLWSLGDMLMATSFKNCVMKRIYEAFIYSYPSVGFVKSAMPTPEEVEYCWTRTTANSTLRKFLIDILIYNSIYRKCLTTSNK